MKFTTAAVLAFTCASALANSVPYEETALYARDLYERGSDEGVLESFEKRKGGKPSLSRSFAGAAGNLGGVVASNAVQAAIQRKMTPQPPPQQQRRSLDARMRRRRLPNPSYFTGSLGPTGKGMATSFLNGFAKGVVARGLEEDVLDELD